MVAAPIRIVPLRTEALAPLGLPRLTYRGGPLLTSVEAFLFFWGDAWTQQAELMEKVSGFFDYIVGSPPGRPAVRVQRAGLRHRARLTNRRHRPHVLAVGGDRRR